MKLPGMTLLMLFLAVIPAHADTSVFVHLFKADPASKEGFKETYKWQMGETDEFRRFEYMASKMKKGEQAKISPFIRKPDEMLVVSIKDQNGITGKDYYLTQDGLMITEISSKSSYYEDANNFYTFLKEEISHRSSLEKFPGERISSESPGIVVRYLINETLPNPAWLINTQKDVNLYDSFMRKIPQIDGYQFQYNNPFNEKGNFSVRLNYPKSPAKYATVNKIGIRLSETYSKDSFVQDENDYYKFFYNLTQDSLKMSSETKEKDQRKLDMGNF